MDDRTAVGGLAGEMAQAATEMAEQPTLQATLDSICAQAVTRLRADGCGIFLVKGRRVTVAAISGPQVAAAERVQLHAEEGPCLETIWSSETVLVPDLRQDRRWPRWASQMVEIGLLSTLSVRLVEDGQTVGSLNMFCRTADAFSTDDVALATLFAQHASLVLAASRTEASLEQAVEARHRIGMAQGILMARLGLSADNAFAAMRRHSQQTNTKLQKVAAYVAEHQQLPGQELAAQTPGDQTLAS